MRRDAAAERRQVLHLLPATVAATIHTLATLGTAAAAAIPPAVSIAAAAVNASLHSAVGAAVAAAFRATFHSAVDAAVAARFG